MKKSTAKGKDSKPAPPYPGFPLYAHASGRWAKRIRGKLHYFGQWGTKKRGVITPVDDVHASAVAAIERFHREWPYLSTGRLPPLVATGDACDLRSLCNAFLTFKRNRVETGELTERAFMDLRKVTDLLIAHLKADRRVDDLRPDDFEGLRKLFASRWGPVRLKNVITHVRGVFKFAFDHRLISTPVNYGQAFDRPTAKTLRRARNAAGPRLFERGDLTLILSALDGETFTLDDKEQ